MRTAYLLTVSHVWRGMGRYPPLYHPMSGGGYPPPRSPLMSHVRGLGTHSPRHTHSHPGHTHHLDIPTPRRDLVPEIPPRQDMGPEKPSQPHPHGQTNTCENITFTQLRWRTVTRPIRRFMLPCLLSKEPKSKLFVDFRLQSNGAVRQIDRGDSLLYFKSSAFPSLSHTECLVAFEIISPVVLDSPLTWLSFSISAVVNQSLRDSKHFSAPQHSRDYMSCAEVLCTIQEAKLLDIFSIKRRHVQWWMEIKRHLITANSQVHLQFSLTADKSTHSVEHINSKRWMLYLTASMFLMIFQEYL